VFFSAVEKFWEAAFAIGDIRALPWPQQHALLLSIACILRKPVGAAVEDFLKRQLPFPGAMPLLLYIATGIRAPINIIQDPSLSVLSLSLTVTPRSNWISDRGNGRAVGLTTHADHGHPDFHGRSWNAQGMR
jgi:hypothetical protein